MTVHTVGSSNLAEAWRQAREAKGWNRDDTAAAIGVSPSTLKSIELGRRRPSEVVLRRAAQVLGVNMDGNDSGGGSGSDVAPTTGELEAMLRAGWALFYAGEGRQATGLVQAGLRISSGLSGDAPRHTLGRFHQLAGVLARDSKQLGAATTHGAAAVQIARQLGEPDHLAAALFRLGRTEQQRGDHGAALQLIREAHMLAPRCRQPLSGWLKLARVEAESKAAAAGWQGLLNSAEQRRLLDQVQADMMNRAGQDDSFTALSVSGLWHIEVLALLSAGTAQSGRDALTLIGNALRRLEPNQHRWRHGMLATEVLAYAVIGDADMAADMAADVLRLTRATSHLNYLRRALRMLSERDPQRQNPHTARLRTMLAAV